MLSVAPQDDLRIYFVLEYISGGDFYKLLRTIPEGGMNEDAARFYIVEIVLAFEYLHNYNIMFRDLKPENVLITADGHVRVTDFGLAIQVGPKNKNSKAHRQEGDDDERESRGDTVCGTPEYMVSGR